MRPSVLRRRLAAVFPGAFLLAKRCRCVVHVIGREGDPNARVAVEPCRACRRYAAYLSRGDHSQTQTAGPPTPAVC